MRVGIIFVREAPNKQQNLMSIKTTITHPFTYNVVLSGKMAVVRQDGKALTTDDVELIRKQDPMAEIIAEEENDLCVGILGKEYHLPEGYEAIEIRRFFATHEETEVRMMARAKAISSWRSSMRYCPKCGSTLHDHPTLSARECKECGALHFPKIEPCVIVAVRRGEEILLARHVERNQDIYACIAGFVEAGETLEHALRREIREEVGIEVKNIRYFGSQSWPFPYQLMVGFTAEYESGEIKIQQEELTDARWFSIHDLPNHPRPGSISHELIHAMD